MLAFMAAIPSVALCADEPVVLKIGSESITKSQIEKEFALVSGAPDGAAVWDKLPEQVKTSFIEGFVRQHMLQGEANKTIKADDPRVTKLMARMQEQIRTQLYAEDKLKELVNDDSIKAAYEKMKKSADKPMVYQMLQIMAPDEQAAAAARKSLAEGTAVANVVAANPALKSSNIELSSKDGIFPSISKAITKLKPGELSQPVKTEFGWHVFMLTSKHEGDYPPLEEMKEKLGDELRQSAWRKYVDEMVKKSSVHYYGDDGKEKKLEWKDK